MQIHTFNAVVISEENERYAAAIQQRSIDSLPDHQLLIRVHYSSLNYKDALSASGNKGVTRSYPHTPGIDAAGAVVADQSGAFKVGDPVIVTGYDLGMNTDGGHAEYIRVPAEWALPLPHGLSLQESMMLGTAGLTAAQCLDALTAKLSPRDGDILVTGATGGVGSLAVNMLAQLGFKVYALTGKAAAVDYLYSLGAVAVVDRQTFLDENTRPLSKPSWAGVVDTVGGDVLASAIKSTQPLGVVTCIGMAGSPDLSLTVFPFILRGVSLIGIDSQHCPMPLRQLLWQKMAKAWKPTGLAKLVEQIALADIPAALETMLAGRHRGRILVAIK